MVRGTAGGVAPEGMLARPESLIGGCLGGGTLGMTRTMSTAGLSPWHRKSNTSTPLPPLGADFGPTLSASCKDLAGGGV